MKIRYKLRDKTLAKSKIYSYESISKLSKDSGISKDGLNKLLKDGIVTQKVAFKFCNFFNLTMSNTFEVTKSE